MRSLALLLLLMNIGFLTWQCAQLPWLPWQPAQFLVVDAPLPSSSHLPQLVLLRERQQAQSAPQKPETPAAREDKPGAETAYISHKPVTQTTDSAVNGRKSTPATVTQSVSTADSHLNSDTVQDDKPVKMSKLQQLKQVATTAAEQGAQPPEPKQPPPLKVAEVNSEQEILACFQVGPYTQLSLATQALEWFQQQKPIERANIRKGKTKIPASTWVYLPAFNTRRQARQEQQRLAQQGLTDYMIITEGKFENAISLGLYRNPNSVERRLKELQAKGYSQVKTEKRYKYDTRYWLNVKLFQKAQKALLKAFNTQFKEQTVQSVACE